MTSKSMLFPVGLDLQDDPTSGSWDVQVTRKDPISSSALPMPPANIVISVKSALQSRYREQNCQSTSDTCPKIEDKRTRSQEAFPLETRTQFWHRLLTGTAPDTPNSNVVSYVALNPVNKREAKQMPDVVLINDKVIKEVRDKMAGDKVEEIAARVGKHTLKKRKKWQKESSKGDGWFGMKAQEMTEETKRNLEVLKMRGAIDPKRFYKKNEIDALPKYFQIGQVIDSPTDYYANKSSGKKKTTLVDELMADAEFQKYSKRKYAEIIEEKAKLDPRKRHKKSLKKQKQ